MSVLLQTLVSNDRYRWLRLVFFCPRSHDETGHRVNLSAQAEWYHADCHGWSSFGAKTSLQHVFTTAFFLKQCPVIACLSFYQKSGPIPFQFEE